MKQTAKDRFSRALRRVSEWCRRHRHDPLKKQQHVLTKKLSGHYAYYGITTNRRGISRFPRAVIHTWWQVLKRRSQRRLPWWKMEKLLERYPLPAPRIVHRYST